MRFLSAFVSVLLAGLAVGHPVQDDPKKLHEDYRRSTDIAGVATNIVDANDVSNGNAKDADIDGIESIWSTAAANGDVPAELFADKNCQGKPWPLSTNGCPYIPPGLRLAVQSLRVRKGYLCNFFSKPYCPVESTTVTRWPVGDTRQDICIDTIPPPFHKNVQSGVCKPYRANTVQKRESSAIDAIESTGSTAVANFGGIGGALFKEKNFRGVAWFIAGSGHCVNMAKGIDSTVQSLRTYKGFRCTFWTKPDCHEGPLDSTQWSVGERNQDMGFGTIPIPFHRNIKSAICIEFWANTVQKRDAIGGIESTGSTGIDFNGFGGRLYKEKNLRGVDYYLADWVWCINLPSDWQHGVQSLIVFKGYVCYFHTKPDCQMSPDSIRWPVGSPKQDTKFDTIPTPFDRNVQSAYCKRTLANSVQKRERSDLAVIPRTESSDPLSILIYKEKWYKGDPQGIAGVAQCTNLKDLYGDYDKKVQSFIMMKRHKCYIYRDLDCPINTTRWEIGGQQIERIPWIAGPYELSIRSMLCSRIKAEALQGQEKDDDSRPEAQNEVQEEKRDTNGGISHDIRSDGRGATVYKAINLQGNNTPQDVIGIPGTGNCVNMSNLFGVWENKIRSLSTEPGYRCVFYTVLGCPDASSKLTIGDATKARVSNTLPRPFDEKIQSARCKRI